MSRAYDTSPFWTRYTVSESGCHEWTGPLDPDGYGVCSYGRAHRSAYSRVLGPIPPGMVVMHGCDNPRCINIYHLRLGTQSENMQDMRRKGRGVKGGPRLRGGSIRPTKQGYEVIVSLGRDGSGRYRQLSRSVRGSRADAEAKLAAMLEELRLQHPAIQ